MGYTVVIGYDGSSGAKTALEAAVRLAKAEADGQVIMTCAQHHEPSWVGMTPLGSNMQAEHEWEETTKRIVAELESAAETVRAAGVSCGTVCSGGRPADVVVNAAKEANADIIVVGAIGSGGSRGLLGSTVSGVLRHAHVPVLVVPE
jgi:nucleotide-binding universal stress UspA family protein